MLTALRKAWQRFRLMYHAERIRWHQRALCTLSARQEPFTDGAVSLSLVAVVTPTRIDAQHSELFTIEAETDSRVELRAAMLRLAADVLNQTIQDEDAPGIEDVLAQADSLTQQLEDEE